MKAGGGGTLTLTTWQQDRPHHRDFHSHNTLGKVFYERHFCMFVLSGRDIRQTLPGYLVRKCTCQFTASFIILTEQKSHNKMYKSGSEIDKTVLLLVLPRGFVIQVTNIRDLNVIRT